MDLRHYFPRAWVLVGVGVFALGVSRGEVLLSSAPLMGAATGASVLPEEPFVNPFGTKKPKIVSAFGKRNIPEALRSLAVARNGAGPTKLGTQGMASPFSERHEGVDYTALPGSAVRAARSGKVIFAGFSKMYVSRADKNEQNRLVIIRHADGKSSRYVHLSALHIRPGQDVQSGQVLGVLAESDE